MAHNIKIPVPLENHSQEVYNQTQETKIDLNENIARVHEKMKEILKPVEWKVYTYLYIQDKSEEEEWCTTSVKGTHCVGERTPRHCG